MNIEDLFFRSKRKIKEVFIGFNKNKLFDEDGMLIKPIRKYEGVIHKQFKDLWVDDTIIVKCGLFVKQEKTSSIWKEVNCQRCLNYLVTQENEMEM